MTEPAGPTLKELTLFVLIMASLIGLFQMVALGMSYLIYLRPIVD